MFSTVNSVKQYTGLDVTLELIGRAQSIVEIFIGKDEIDVIKPEDLMLLDKMTAYQTAYMLDNEDMVYKQIASQSINVGGSVQNFDSKMNSPWIAPLVILASNGLSFKKTRNIKTGKIFQWPSKIDWKKY